MQILEDIQGVTESAKQSATVSMNAARDAYTWLEAKRKGNEEELLKETAQIYRTEHGCSVAESYEEVSKRAKYLDELAIGKSTFYAGKEQLDYKAKQTNAGSPKPA